jgi:hypothetical protein
LKEKTIGRKPVEANGEDAMKRLILALSAIMLCSLAGWGQSRSRDQSRANVSAHQQEAHNQSDRRHHRRHHRRHRRHHNGA